MLPHICFCCILKHGLPFASFVGVNHHEKSTLLGCALLGSEEIPSFEWVFTQWVRCVGTVPRGIITVQCMSMAGAIRKLGDYARYGELSAMMKHIVYNSPSSESFEVDWAGFIKEFELGQNRWLDPSAGGKKKTDCVVRSTEQKRDTISIKVDEQKVFWGKPVYHTFIVEFDPLSGKSRRECNKFESAGILCCHTLTVWSYYRVDTIPSCYVLL
ncbi:hypothetical protein Ahy_A03g014526 [Arachis hypogaea]|uniref:MULE transposase domain-containing protein n=1 Tax=Arachis hypogaea TaxID=3818 RepID=A0A445DXY8_ARAHY|nr:hypothetical protein Ahy_A03g014526 [Arachis hypogaea]